MHTGMLWMTNKNSTLTLGQKIEQALDYYAKKYGRTPDLCLLHPSMLEKEQPEIPGLTIRPYRPVLPGHIWIGVEARQEELFAPQDEQP